MVFKHIWCKILPIACGLLSSGAYGQDVRGLSFASIGELSAECFYNDAGEFVLKGGFDTEARVCFSQTYKMGTKVIRINSNGGQNAIGLGLAHRLKDENFHLIIEGRCNSACALYIMPLAKAITMERGAGVVIHGALSEFYLTKKHKDIFINQDIKQGRSRREARKRYKHLEKYAKIQIETAEKFRVENNVGRGWFMQAGAWTEDDIQSPVKDVDVDWLEKKKTNGFLIDRTFLETCLPDVKINQFFGPSDPESQSFEGYKDRIESVNIIILPNAQCINS